MDTIMSKAISTTFIFILQNYKILRISQNSKYLIHLSFYLKATHYIYFHFEQSKWQSQPQMYKPTPKCRKHYFYQSLTPSTINGARLPFSNIRVSLSKMERLAKKYYKPKETPPMKVTLPKHKKHPNPSKPTSERKPSAPKDSSKNKQKTNKHLFYRKHFYNKNQITEVSDLKNGSSTYRTKASIKYVLDDFNQIEKIGEQFVNVSPLSSNDYHKTEWKELYPPQRCHCKKSLCKQNYCPCYQMSQKCASQCQCDNCQNVLASKTEELIRPSSWILSTRQCKSIELLGYEESTVQGLFCHCSRNSSCLKSTCGCRKLGINCSQNCNCVGCTN